MPFTRRKGAVFSSVVKNLQGCVQQQDDANDNEDEATSKTALLVKGPFGCESAINRTAAQ
jgi:hypothetical protein